MEETDTWNKHASNNHHGKKKKKTNIHISIHPYQIANKKLLNNYELTENEMQCTHQRLVANHNRHR